MKINVDNCHVIETKYLEGSKVIGLRIERKKKKKKLVVKYWM